jgi:hypothetical protein
MRLKGHEVIRPRTDLPPPLRMDQLVVAPDGGGSATIQIATVPHECPVCHTGIEPERILDRFHGSTQRGRLQIVYRCPKRECRSLFIAAYTPGTTFVDNVETKCYVLRDLAPQSFQPEAFSKWIQDASPAFVAIYNEATAAEMYGLSHSCGPTYRKALEFLLKDYFIAKHPNEEQEIRESKSLTALIKKYVDDERLKTCAERAAWLGNDEVHYDRKWADKDVRHLKQVINLATRWLDQILETEELLADMPHGK